MAAVRLSERVVCKLMGLNWTSLRYQPKKNADSSLRAKFKSTCHPITVTIIWFYMDNLAAKRWLKIANIHIILILKKACRFETRNAKKLIQPRQPMDFVSGHLSNDRRFRVLNVVDENYWEKVRKLVLVSISGRQVAKFLSLLVE